MLYGILKRNLKHKKTATVIMLLFVILAVAFISASANNLFAVFDSLDRYFERAGIGDYDYFAMEFPGDSHTVADAVGGAEWLGDIRTEESLIVTYEFAAKNDGEIGYRGDEAIATCPSNSIYKLFDDGNEPIVEVEDGYVYLRQSLLSQADAQIGDRIMLTVDGIRQSFIVKDIMKDVLLGSDLANVRFLISDNDYSAFENALAETNAEKVAHTIYLHIIDTDDISALESALSDCGGITFSGDRNSFRSTYLSEMVIVGIMAAVSVGFILTAIAILSFTISAAIDREYRQIGIMKAIGIKNGRIRSLYPSTYLAIAVIGALTGAILSIPIGKLLLKNLSKSIFIENKYSFLITLVCACAAILLITLFSFIFTRKVIRITPMDALRNGSTEKRYRKKSLIPFSRVPIRPTVFLAANDIFNKPMQSCIMAFIFFMGMLLIMIVLNIGSTMCSSDTVLWQGEIKSDMRIVEIDPNRFEYACSDGRDKVCALLDAQEKMLATEGWDATCHAETRVFSIIYPIGEPERSLQAYCLEGVNSDIDDYTYIAGSAPQSRNELAISCRTSDALKVGVGDSLIVTTADGEAECIITAIYEEVMLKQWGSIRRYPDPDYNYEGMIETFETRVRFTDNPNAAEVSKRVELLRQKHSEYRYKTMNEQLIDWFGNIPEKINSVSSVMLMLIILVDIMVAVLIELSTINAERGHLAMLKAIGFNDRTIILREVLRITFVMLGAVLFAVAFAKPVGKLILGDIFRNVGIKKAIFVPDVWKNYVFYPAVSILATVFCVFLAALRIRKIPSSEINSIE